MASGTLDLWLEDMHNGDVGLRLRLTGVLLAETTPFQRLAVYDSPAFGKVLDLGGEIVLTDADGGLYAEGILHPAMQSHPNPKRVCIIGGGDGGVAREACRYDSVEQVRVVEIDARVVEVCREHFPDLATGLDDPRVDLVIDDAHRYLVADDQAPYDVMIIDAAELHDPASDAVQSTTFATTLTDRLAPGGVLVTPIGSPFHAAHHCLRNLRELRGAFNEVSVFQVAVPSLPGGSMAFAWASQSGDPRQLYHAEAAWIPDLTFWEPALTDRLFTLPKPLRLALGL